MSGSPKFVDVGLVGLALAAVEAARAIQAAQEEAARRRAEEAERQRQFYNYQRGLQDFVVEVGEQYAAIREGLKTVDDMALSEKLARLSSTVRNSSDRAAVARAEMELRQFQREVLDRERQAQREAQQAAIADERERLLAELGGLDGMVNALRDEGAAELDATGRATALAALNAARSHGNSPNPQVLAATLAEARKAVEAHQQTVRAAQTRLLEQRQAAQTRLDAAAELAAGLLADPAVQLWALAQGQELAARVAGWRIAFDSGDPAAPAPDAVEQFKADHARLLERANAAQVRAETRDYIARSVREVLEEMGFMVGAAQEEHPGHPATALTFRAVNAAGQSIGVSVPVDGQVWYDIDGYPKTTETQVGGGKASACDTAQAVLEEMHAALEAQHGVQAGELMWEGKDPLRLLRQADQLPRSDDAPGREGRR